MPEIIVDVQPVVGYSIYCCNPDTDKEIKKRLVATTYPEAQEALATTEFTLCAMGFRVERVGNGMGIARRGRNTLRYGILPETELPN